MEIFFASFISIFLTDFLKAILEFQSELVKQKLNSLQLSRKMGWDDDGTKVFVD